jgi:hypothetical protein
MYLNENGQIKHKLTTATPGAATTTPTPRVPSPPQVKPTGLSGILNTPSQLQTTFSNAPEVPPKTPSNDTQKQQQLTKPPPLKRTNAIRKTLTSSSRL